MATLDYYDDTYQPGYGTDALIAQDYKLKQREAALIEQMKAAASQIGVQPQGQMVSGRYVAPSKSQMLLPLVQQIANQVQEKKLTEDRSGYRALEARAINNHLAQMPSDDDSIQAKLKWAQAGAQIPALRSQMTDYAKDLLIKEPDRIATLQDRKDARADRAVEAEKARQGKAEEAQRQRDFQGQQNDANRDLRATIAAAVRAHSGSEKASDYQVFQGADGSLTRVNKLTGESSQLGGGGKPSANFEKQQQESQTKVQNAKTGLDTLSRMEPLLGKATSSGVGAMRDKAFGQFGMSTSAGDAAGELQQMGNSLVQLIDRSGLGPQFSDADVRFLKDTAGGLGDPTVPESRKRATLKRVREQFQRTVDQSPSAPRSSGNLRQDIIKAAKSLDSGLAGGGANDTQNLMLQEYRKATSDADRAAIKRELDRAGYKGPLPGESSTAGPKVRTYNPATGRLE